LQQALVIDDSSDSYSKLDEAADSNTPIDTGKWRFITTKKFHLDNIAFYVVKSRVSFFTS